MTRDEQEQIKLENQLKRINETVLLCTEFLLTNASDIDLGNKTGISSSTVGRRLTNQVYIYKSYDMVVENLKNAGFKEEQIPKKATELFELIQTKRHENLLRGKALGGQTTLLNHVYLKDETSKFQGVTKLSLSAFYTDPTKQYKFLIHSALYFRLHLDTLSVLFQIEEKELLENILRIGSGNYDALKTLLYHDNRSQEDARNEFVNYYRELLEAVRHKNIEEKKRLITLISDEKAINLRKKIQEDKKISNHIYLSEEDIEILIRYQLKYSLTVKDIAYIFDINRSNLQKRIAKFLEDKIDLKNQYENLLIYNESKYKSVNGGYRGK